MSEVPLNLGRVGLYYRGNYSATTTYEYLDFVRGTDGMYIYIASTSSSGSLLTDTAKWAVMATNGQDGQDGQGGVHVGTTAPTGTEMLWIDTTT